MSHFGLTPDFRHRRNTAGRGPDGHILKDVTILLSMITRMKIWKRSSQIMSHCPLKIPIRHVTNKAGNVRVT
jgi:hypothetical protein